MPGVDTVSPDKGIAEPRYKHTARVAKTYCTVSIYFVPGETNVSGPKNRGLAGRDKGGDRVILSF
jgi:hypothetical protein